MQSLSFALDLTPYRYCQNFGEFRMDHNIPDDDHFLFWVIHIVFLYIVLEKFSVLLCKGRNYLIGQQALKTSQFLLRFNKIKEFNKRFSIFVHGTFVHFANFDKPTWETIFCDITKNNDSEYAFESVCWNMCQTDSWSNGNDWTSIIPPCLSWIRPYESM